MPLYTYKCESCGNKFTQNESKMTTGRKERCIGYPLCDGEAVRVVAKSSFALKGKGWYKDGY